MKKLRFVIYFVIIILSYLSTKIEVRGGISSSLGVPFLILMAIPLIELGYTIYKKRNVSVLKVVLLIILLVILGLMFYREKKKVEVENKKFSCRYAVCENDDYKNCNIYDDEKNIMVKIDCSEFFSE